MSSIFQYQNLFAAAIPVTRWSLVNVVNVWTFKDRLMQKLFIQFHLYLSTNKQWLADFKILYISSSCTNIPIPFMKSISFESTIRNFAILRKVWYIFQIWSVFFDQNIIFASSFIAMLQTTNLFIVFKNNNYYLCRFYHECAFYLVIWLIGQYD